MNSSFYKLCTLLLLCIAPCLHAQNSPATTKAVEQIEVLNMETGHYGGYVDQWLLRCSLFQDIWLAYLHNVENTDEYHRGMQLMHDKAPRFRSVTNYIADIVNFFNPGVERFLRTEAILLGNQKNHLTYGFLNTFKTGRYLLQDERAQLYYEESKHFDRDAVVYPFTLNEETLEHLLPETVYNFALHADNTIRLALEKPGRHAYYVQGNESEDYAFTHPNHTILAGSPHQLLLTGGALLFFQVDDRRLYFISNKSGHFVPYFYSLHQMVDAMEGIGVNRYTVIEVPDLDIASVALKLYRGVQVPISLGQTEIAHLFKRAHDRWIQALDALDIDSLQALAEGDLSILTPTVIAEINEKREEGTYIRSAFQLFSDKHKAPRELYQFVKRFGILKDAIVHGVRERIQSEATQTLKLFKKYHDLLQSDAIQLTSIDSIRDYLTQKLNEVDELLTHETLSAENFHTVKKWSRELAVLFMLLAEEHFTDGQGYFLYRATSKEFFRVNELMAQIHDTCVRDDMLGKDDYDQMIVSFEDTISCRLKRLIACLRVAPSSFSLDIPSDNGFWFINCCKDWYQWHAYISHHPSSTDFQNYDPRAKNLLERIATGTFCNIENEDDEVAVNHLLTPVLAAAEYAQTGLLFLDRRHTVDEELNRYINSLKKIIYRIKHQTSDDIVNEANNMLTYMQNRGVPTRQLEEYLPSDQESFNAVLAEKMDVIKKLTTEKIASDNTLESVQAVRNILELYRHAGVQYQSYPSICYDLSKEAAERLYKNLEKDSIITEEILTDAHYLLKQLHTTHYD